MRDTGELDAKNYSLTPIWQKVVNRKFKKFLNK